MADCSITTKFGKSPGCIINAGTVPRHIDYFQIGPSALAPFLAGLVGIDGGNGGTLL